MKLQPQDFQKIPISRERINKFLNGALSSLGASKDLFKAKRYKQSLILAYEAMLQASIALAQSYGIRAKQAKHHYLMVQLADRILPKKYQDVVKYYDRLRKKRHSAIYDIKQVTMFEAEKAIETADNYICLIEKHIRDKDPQKKFKF